MIRYPSFIIFFLIVFVAISLYQVKYLITQKELELSVINKNIIRIETDLNILKAELSYLKRPKRIENLAKNKFCKVNFFKPDSSRDYSKETYIHCAGIKTL